MIDLDFLGAVLNGNAEDFSQAKTVDPKLLQPPANDIFTNIIGYVQAFDEVPTKSILSDHFPEDELKKIPDSVDGKIPYYRDLILKRAMRARLAQGLGKALTSLRDGDVFEALELVKDSVAAGEDLRVRERIYEEVTDYEGRVAAYLQRKTTQGEPDGRTTPWETLNRLTMGLHPGETTGIIGRYGTGKTWAMVAMAEFDSRVGGNPVIVSPEVAGNVMGRRFDALITRVPYGDLRRGQLDYENEERYLRDVAEKYRGRQAIPVYGPNEVKHVEDLDPIVDRHNPTILFVDSMYLIPGGKTQDRYTRVAEAATYLMLLAQRKEVPIVFTTQFNREGSRKALKKMATSDDAGYAVEILHSSSNFFAIFQDEDFRRNKQMLWSFLKGREMENNARGMVTNWDLTSMNFDLLGAWDGDKVIPVTSGLEEYSY